MRLIEDIVSNFKGYVYAKNGTEVTLISTTLHVAIVENNETKERFSCRIDSLTEDITITVETIKEEKTKQILNPAAKTKTKKQPLQQNTLF